MIYVTPSISLAEHEIQEDFIRTSGPGGQNVNKVATGVQLRFDAANSPSLPDEVKERLLRLAGRRLTAEGILVIDARRFRNQERNRQDALERLVELIRRAAERPASRRQTRPTAASQQRRVEVKRRRSSAKRLRGRISADTE